MQNQPKTVKTSKRRSPTTRVGLKSIKDDFGNTHTIHQDIIHQNMMNAPQNEDIAVKSSTKTRTFMNFEQQATFSEIKFSSYEKVQEQLESTLNAVLAKDECFKSNSPGYLASILVDRIHARPGFMSQIFELKASNTLQNLDLYRKLLETQQEFPSFNQNCSPKWPEVLDLVEDPRRDDDIKLITEDFNLKSPQTLNLCDFQVDDPGAKHSQVNESWSYLEELKLCPTSLPQDLTIENLDQDKVWTHFKRTLLWNCNADKPAIKCLQFNELSNSYSIKGYSVNREEKFKNQGTKLSREADRKFYQRVERSPTSFDHAIA